MKFSCTFIYVCHMQPFELIKYYYQSSSALFHFFLILQLDKQLNVICDLLIIYISNAQMQWCMMSTKQHYYLRVLKRLTCCAIRSDCQVIFATNIYLKQNTYIVDPTPYFYPCFGFAHVTFQFIQSGAQHQLSGYVDGTNLYLRLLAVCFPDLSICALSGFPKC